MISDSFSLREFVNAVKDKSLHEVLILADGDITAAQQAPPRPRSARKYRARDEAPSDYAAQLKGLVWFLHTGWRSATKPTGVSRATFVEFGPLIGSLVERGELEPEARDQFHKALQNAPDWP